MKIIRPLCFFDLESTGLETEKARIVSIAVIKLFPDGRVEEKDILINPEIPIPKEVSDIHGITDDMVKDAPTFKQLANGISNFFKGSDIGGFNSDNYDVPLLMAEMSRAGVTDFLSWDFNLLDVSKVYRELFPNTLSAIFKRLTGNDLEGAHNALEDVRATKIILDIILPKLAESSEQPIETPKDIDLFLQKDKKRVDIGGKMYEDSEGVIRWNFSKNKDLPVLSDIGFLGWFMKQDFPEQSKDIIIKLQQKSKINE